MRHEVHNAALSRFIALGEADKAALAERMGISRRRLRFILLSHPRNLDLETIADLFLAMGCTLTVDAKEIPGGAQVVSSITPP